LAPGAQIPPRPLRSAARRLRRRAASLHGHGASRAVPGPRRPHARPPGLWRPGRKFHRGLYARTARRLSGGALSCFMATVRPGRCPVRGVRMRGRLGFGARGANSTAAFTLEQRDAFQAARCLASWPRCVPGVARSAASAGRPPGLWRRKGNYRSLNANCFNNA